jgi:hypothetical protein
MALLPKEPTTPKTSLSDFNIVIYGPPKIGKTTLAAQFPGALFLATEDGQNAIECYRVQVDSWQRFLDACAELQAGGHGFESIVVDTVDNLWGLCQRHVCEKRGIEHESELAYGLGAELIRTEFFRALTKLSMLPYGLVLISHSVVREITTRTGKHDRVIPSFKEREQGKLLGMADFVLLADLLTTPGPDGKPETRRVIRTKTSESWVSGDRTGRLPDPLPLDFGAFKSAFDTAVAAHHAGQATKAKATRAAAPKPVPAPTATPSASAAPAGAKTNP